jgi:hypothetical protein
MPYQSRDAVCVRTAALRQERSFHNRSLRDSAATANRPSDRGGKPSISNIGLQLRQNSLIVDQLAASIISLLAQISGSRENARVSIGKHLPDWDEKAMEINRADVAELVDARDFKNALRYLKALNFFGKHNLAFGFNRPERSEIWKTFLGASDGPHCRHSAHNHAHGARA